MVNNTIGIQSGIGKDAAIRFVTERNNKPAVFFTNSDVKGWFWPQAGVYARDRLFVFLPLIEKTKEPGAFGFKQIGQWLAIVDNPADEPEKWRVKLRQLPMVEFAVQRQRSWGSTLLVDGDDLYVYGFDERRERGEIRRQLTVARVAVAKLEEFTAWQFRGAEGWSDKPGDAAALADGLGTEFSVSRAPGGKGYIAVYTENGLSDRIVSRFADRPEGLWSAPRVVVSLPGNGQGQRGFQLFGQGACVGGEGKRVAHQLLRQFVGLWQIIHGRCRVPPQVRPSGIGKARIGYVCANFHSWPRPMESSKRLIFDCAKNRINLLSTSAPVNHLRKR